MPAPPAPLKDGARNSSGSKESRERQQQQGGRKAGAGAEPMRASTSAVPMGRKPSTALSMENKGSVMRSGSKDDQGKRNGVKNSVQGGSKEGKGAAKGGVAKEGATKKGEAKEGAGGRRSRTTANDERKRRQSAMAAAASASTLHLEELEEEGDEDPLDFFDLGGLLGQLRERLRNRYKKFKKWAAGAKVQAKQAFASEVQQGWGSTRTARTLGDFARLDKKAMRAKGLNMAKQAVTKLLSSSDKSARASLKAMKGEDAVEFGLHRFIIHNPGDVRTFFEIDDKEIKVGGSGKVLRGVENFTHVPRAIKRVYKRDHTDFQRLLREVSIMKKLDHPNIVKLFETFEDEKSLFMVLELCEGGDVLDRMLDPVMLPAGAYSELQAAVIIKTLLMTLNYLHSNGIAHRDIKPENILFKDKHSDILTSTLRIADFGYARRWSEDDQDQGLMTTKVGSLYYVAPEVLAGEYNLSVDLWSTGATCYTLLCGYPPFVGETDAETLDLIKEGKYYFHRQGWQQISKPAKHLVRHLLQQDPQKRLSLQQALVHPWVVSRGVLKIERMREETVERLMAFHRHHRLRRCAMLAIAHQLESSDIRGVLELFQSLDTNGDGLLTSDEFRKSVQSMVGLEEAFIDDMMSSVDADGSGIIDFSEFVAATLEKEMYEKNHAAMLRAFRCFDQDDGGSLDMAEIAETLCMDGPEYAEEVQQFFAEVDVDQDGVMDYGEFYSMLQKDINIVHAIEDSGGLEVLEDSGSEEESEESNSDKDEAVKEENTSVKDEAVEDEEVDRDEVASPTSPKSGGSARKSSGSTSGTQKSDSSSSRRLKSKSSSSTSADTSKASSKGKSSSSSSS